MIEDGEIPFLDADPLHSGIKAPEEERELDADEKAIQSLVARLRQKGGRSEETIDETAVSLYNRICDDIRSGRSSNEQTARAAELFGEDPDDLLKRLQSSE